jgi:hypothetical protein
LGLVFALIGFARVGSGGFLSARFVGVHYVHVGGGIEGRRSGTVIIRKSSGLKLVFPLNAFLISNIIFRDALSESVGVR